MDFEAIKYWLGRWVRRQTNHYWLKGALGLVLAPIALMIALTLVYWLLRLFTRDANSNLGDPRKCFWITLLILPLLFLGNWLVPRRNLMEERMSEGPGASFRPGARGVVLFHFFAWIMFTGPRLFSWASNAFREAQWFNQMDVHSCAAVLWLLLSNPRKVPLQDVKSSLEWLNLEDVLPQLKRVEGVLMLQAPPPGLTLKSDLRNTIRSDLGVNLGPSSETL